MDAREASRDFSASSSPSAPSLPTGTQRERGARPTVARVGAVGKEADWRTLGSCVLDPVPGFDRSCGPVPGQTASTPTLAIPCERQTPERDEATPVHTSGVGPRVAAGRSVVLVSTRRWRVLVEPGLGIVSTWRWRVLVEPGFGIVGTGNNSGVSVTAGNDVASFAASDARTSIGIVDFVAIVLRVARRLVRVHGHVGIELSFRPSDRIGLR